MSRPRNPRRVAHEVLKGMNANITAMVKEWDGPRLIFDKKTHRWERDVFEQQPENNPGQWARLEQFMAVIEQQAAGVREYAQQQRKRLASETEIARRDEGRKR